MGLLWPWESGTPDTGLRFEEGGGTKRKILILYTETTSKASLHMKKGEEFLQRKGENIGEDVSLYFIRSFLFLGWGRECCAYLEDE